MPPCLLNTSTVETAVRQYWQLFGDKDQNSLQNFYLPEAQVFSSTGTRSEPARLAVLRRCREYLNPKTQISFRLGTIEVLTVSETAAVALYTFQFTATDVASSQSQEKILKGRATQLFRTDESGSLRILHEHLSDASQA